MAVNYATSNSYFGLALESVRSTAASVSTYTPIMSPKLTNTVKWQNVQDFRGSPVKTYDAVPLVNSSAISGKCYMMLDVFPQLLRAALGSSDTVASVAPSTWTHTIGLQNSASTGSQPPSYTVVNNSVDNTYQSTGAQLNGLSISFGADAAVEATFDFVGNVATTIAAPTLALNSSHIIPGWDVAASIGGSAVTAIETGTLDIKRSTKPIYTIGQQSPYRNFADALEVSGKLTFVVESGEQWYANALVTNQQQFLLQFNDPFVAGNFVSFQMTNTQLENPQIQQSKAYTEIDVTFEAIGNTTDAVTGGFSNLKTVCRNGISSAY